MKNKEQNKIMIGWTTVSEKSDAEKLVGDLLDMQIIACGQIEGPIDSFYNWDGELRRDQEWRVTIKFSAQKAEEVEKVIAGIHPYETPQWVTVMGGSTREYSGWVNG
jgi:periplasmic divalent cation tolerance protein